MMNNKRIPAWVPCGCCSDFLCTIHKGKHAYECRCPSIDTWAKKGVNPYLEGGNLKNYNLIMQARRAEKPVEHVLQSP